jgi:hypothetical protein
VAGGEMLRGLDAPRLRGALSRVLSSDRRELPTLSDAEPLASAERVAEPAERPRARSAG